MRSCRGLADTDGELLTDVDAELLAEADVGAGRRRRRGRGARELVATGGVTMTAGEAARGCSDPAAPDCSEVSNVYPPGEAGEARDVGPRPCRSRRRRTSPGPTLPTGTVIIDPDTTGGELPDQVTEPGVPDCWLQPPGTVTATTPPAPTPQLPAV